MERLRSIARIWRGCERDPECPEESDPGAFADYINRTLLGHDNPTVIVHACPVRLNERMQVQQGELLCNLVHSPSFSDTLLGMLLKTRSKDQRQVVGKVFVSRDGRIEFLQENQEFVKNRRAGQRKKNRLAKRLNRSASAFVLAIFTASCWPRTRRYSSKLIETMKQMWNRCPTSSSGSYWRL